MIRQSRRNPASGFIYCVVVFDRWPAVVRRFASGRCLGCLLTSLCIVSETVCVPMMQTYNGGPALCSVGFLEVHLDDRLLRERLVAQRALERALSGVHNLMPHELRESV